MSPLIHPGKKINLLCNCEDFCVGQGNFKIAEELPRELESEFLVLLLATVKMGNVHHEEKKQSYMHTLTNLPPGLETPACLFSVLLSWFHRKLCIVLLQPFIISMNQQLFYF